MISRLSDADVDEVLTMFDATDRTIQRLIVVELLWRLVAAEKRIEILEERYGH